MKTLKITLKTLLIIACATLFIAICVGAAMNQLEAKERAREIGVTIQIDGTTYIIEDVYDGLTTLRPIKGMRRSWPTSEVLKLVKEQHPHVNLPTF